MKCKSCNIDYKKEFDEDFINGECLPCRSQREYEDWEKKRKIQVQKYNKKFGTDYEDDDAFYYGCYFEEIEKHTLKRFPLLKEMWKWAQDHRKQEEQLNNFEGDNQMSLFYNDGDLPF